MSQRAKGVVTKFFNGREDPNYGYNQFKAEANQIVLTNLMYKKLPWMMPYNARKIAMLNMKTIALRAILLGKNSISERLRADKSFNFDKSLNAVLDN